jgi:cobalt-precorrin 5A hydrolase
MAGEETMIVAGIGCRRGTSSQEIEKVIGRALAAHGLACGQLDALATEATKGNERGIREAGERLALGLILCATAEMQAVAQRALTVSARVAHLKGVPSVAETAALVAAGRDARLLGPRVANGQATCAIAIGDGS